MIEPKEIIYSKRRTISITIDRNANVIVHAPNRCSRSVIYKFINEKTNWILKKQAEIRKNPMLKLELEEGKTFNILGRTYTISIQNVSKAKISGNTLILPTSEAKESLKRLLVDIAMIHIKKTVEYFASNNNFSYKSITINYAHTRWGSCGYKNSLNFTYKLMLVPTEVVDYVVVHELCHTRIKNHSSAFYQEIEKILPNYKEQEKWLKQNRNIINLI